LLFLVCLPKNVKCTTIALRSAIDYYEIDILANASEKIASVITDLSKSD